MDWREIYRERGWKSTYAENLCEHGTGHSVIAFTVTNSAHVTGTRCYSCYCNASVKGSLFILCCKRFHFTTFTRRPTVKWVQWLTWKPGHTNARNIRPYQIRPGQARFRFLFFIFFFICLFVCLFIIKLCHCVFGCKFASSMLNISVCGLNCRSLQISSEAGQT